MGSYELVNGDENSGKPDSGKNLLAMEEGCAHVRRAHPEPAQSDNDFHRPSPPDVALLPTTTTIKMAHRLISLDVFRGITVALMILADDAGAFVPLVNHSPWDGVTVADFVMPFFLFIVGVALGLAYKSVPNRVASTKKATLRAFKLFLLGLVLQGGYFHGIHNLTYGVDIGKIRWMGTLQDNNQREMDECAFFSMILNQPFGVFKPPIPHITCLLSSVWSTQRALKRIAMAYLLVAVCEIWLRSDRKVDSGYCMLRKYRLQLLVGLVLTTFYVTLLYGLYVPDWEYQVPGEESTTKPLSVKCGARGDTGPACNAVGMLDRKILGIHHLYRRPVYERTVECSINSPNVGPLPPNAPPWCQAPFDPEGLLSSVMAMVTCLIGLQFGHVIVHFKDHYYRIFHWMVASFCLLALACALDLFGMRTNKALYSVSYTCVTAGTAGLLFAGIYVLVDVYGYRRPTYVMEWTGMHALMIYILVACNILPVFLQGFYWRDPRNNILTVLIGIGS